MLIDAHIHLMPDKRMASGIRWIFNNYAPATQFLSPELDTPFAAAQLDSWGVDYFFNYYYPLRPGQARENNNWQHQVGCNYPKAFPFASIHPADADKAGIIAEALDDLQLVGFKLHPYIQDFSPDDEHLTEFYRALERREGLLTLHTGFSDFYRGQNQVEAVFKILNLYPGIHFVLAHALFPDYPLKKMGEILENHPRVYLDLTNVIGFLKPGQAEFKDVEDLVEAYAPRLLYGTDYPMSVGAPPELYNWLTELKVAPGQLAWLKGKTALRIMRRFGNNTFPQKKLPEEGDD